MYNQSNAAIFNRHFDICRLILTKFCRKINPMKNNSISVQKCLNALKSILFQPFRVFFYSRKERMNKFKIESDYNVHLYVEMDLVDLCQTKETNLMCLLFLIQWYYFDTCHVICYSIWHSGIHRLTSTSQNVSRLDTLWTFVIQQKWHWRFLNCIISHEFDIPHIECLSVSFSFSSSVSHQFRFAWHKLIFHKCH